jgi:ribose transport system permease protein
MPRSTSKSPAENGNAETERTRSAWRCGPITQEVVVTAIAVALFAGFSVMLPGFFAVGNLLSLLQGVSVMGILGIAMGLVVIGRGIDLTMVATMTMSVGWTFYLMNGGTPVFQALALGFGFSLMIGIIAGIFIAYVEVSALFTTLALATMVYGFGRLALFDQDVIYLPPKLGWITAIGSGSIFGIPSAVVDFAIIATLAAGFLNYTKYGRYVRAVGDNPQAARIRGIPIRPLIVGQYAISSSIAFAAGLVSATLVSSINTRQVGSSLIYDVILIVVLGGIGLGGGKGGVRNVIVGAILIGIMFNGMTIMNISYTTQNLIKGAILLIAILIDTVINPRDEQTSQQGDI